MKILTRKRRKGETRDEYIDAIYEKNKSIIDTVLGPELMPSQSAKAVFRGLVKQQQADLREEGKRSDVASAAKAVGRTTEFDPNRDYAAENFLSGLQKRGKLDEFAEKANIKIQKRIKGRFAGYTKGEKMFDPTKLKPADDRDNALIYDNRVLVEYDGSLDKLIISELF